MTTTSNSTGHKLKQAINSGDIKARAEALAPIIFKAANSPSYEPGPQNTTDLVGDMIHDSTKERVEDFADACIIIRDKLKQSEYGAYFLADLPRYVRDNIVVWLDEWFDMFYSLHCYNAFDAVKDYYSVEFPNRLSEADIQALEEKYLPKK